MRGARAAIRAIALRGRASPEIVRDRPSILCRDIVAPDVCFVEFTGASNIFLCRTYATGTLGIGATCAPSPHELFGLVLKAWRIRALF